MQLSLAFCQAPRVARTAEGVEEPFGFESREFLRKMVIGHVVKFAVLYKVDAISRSFGTISLEDKDIVREMVSNGMVSVRSERDDKGHKALYEEFAGIAGGCARQSPRNVERPQRRACREMDDARPGVLLQSQ